MREKFHASSEACRLQLTCFAGALRLTGRLDLTAFPNLVILDISDNILAGPVPIDDLSERLGTLVIANFARQV